MSEFGAVSVVFAAEAEVLKLFFGVFFEFGALGFLPDFVFLGGFLCDLEDLVFCVLEFFCVGDWLSVGVCVVVVGSVLVFVFVAAAVDGVFEDVFEFVCFLWFDGEDCFSVLLVAAAEVLEYFGGFGEGGVFGFEVVDFVFEGGVCVGFVVALVLVEEVDVVALGFELLFGVFEECCVFFAAGVGGVSE